MPTPQKYELDLTNSVLKADGPEDHARLMQAIEAMKALHIGQGTTPAPTATNSVTTPSNDDPTALKLGELLEKFFLLRKVKQATALGYKNATDEFSKFLKNPPITRITTSDITRWQEHLAKKGNVPRTIDGKVGVIKAIYNFAKKQGYTREDNPAENRDLLTKKQKQRGGYAIFEKEELDLLFRSEFFREQQIKDPDYAHAIILCLFTGCRIGEITNLKIDQFKISNKGTPYITIRDSKTLAGIREVPLHPYVSIYMSVFMGNKTDKLFKYVEKEGKGSGNAVGKKFARNLESAGITRDKLVFHSLRKFVNNELLRNKVSLEHRCQFIGHELDNVNVAVYTNSINIDDLAVSVFPTFDSIVKIVNPVQSEPTMNNIDLEELLDGTLI
jgi:site-specific recombinase XerD